MSASITVLNVLCTLLPIITFSSPATIFLPVLLNKTSNHEVIEMPPLALTTQMLQCFLYAIYAYHLQMWTLLIPNVAGFILGFVWSTIYPLQVSPDGGLQLQWRVQYGGSLLLMLLGALTIHTMPHLSSTIAGAVGVVMCTYPLPSMKQAYTENNPNLMGSTAMNLAMFINCLAWGLHSSPLVEYEISVLVPNTAGLAVQGSALMLRAIMAKRSGVVHGNNAELSASTTMSVSTPLLWGKTGRTIICNYGMCSVCSLGGLGYQVNLMAFA